MMTTNQMAAGGSADQAAPIETSSPGSRSPGEIPAHSAPRRRRTVLAWCLLALIPVSAVAAFAVLLLMAAASASATGGCGGG